MYTTYDDAGKFNNYPKETKMYYAEEPSRVEKRHYLIQGILALVFVSSLILISLAIS
jgi:hypothetical protein